MLCTRRRSGFFKGPSCKIGIILFWESLFIFSASFYKGKYRGTLFGVMHYWDPGGSLYALLMLEFPDRSFVLMDVALPTSTTLQDLKLGTKLSYSSTSIEAS